MTTRTQAPGARCVRLLAMLLAGVLMLARPGWADASETLLRARIASDILSTDPGTKRDENTDAVQLHIVEGLVAFREDTSVGPLLADTVTVNPAGTEYVFRLRDGVRFHNGAPLTAADVVWSLNRYLDPATRWRCLADVDGRGATKITAVEEVDPLTVRIKLEAPSALFLATLARIDCGGTGILHRDSLAADGGWRAPVGTGPFKLGRWQPGEYVELERFADYAARPEPRDGNTGGKMALVDRVRFFVIPDASAAKAALLSGAIDVLDGVSPAELAELKGNSSIVLAPQETLGFYAILLQTTDPALRDVRLRQALALALDTAGIAEAATEGLARANHAAVPRGSPYFAPALERGPAPDPARAKALLREAGYKGQPLKLVTNKRYPQMYAIGVLAQAMGQSVGLNIELEVLDWAAQLDRYTRGDFQMMAFSYSARLDPALTFDAFMGAKADAPRKVWDDPAAQALLRESMATADPAVRTAVFADLHGRMLEQVPLIVLYNPTQVSAYRADVTGFKPWPAAQQRLWGVAVR